MKPKKEHSDKEGEREREGKGIKQSAKLKGEPRARPRRKGGGTRAPGSLICGASLDAPRTAVEGGGGGPFLSLRDRRTTPSCFQLSHAQRTDGDALA